MSLSERLIARLPDAHCMKCRVQRKMKNPYQHTLENGTPVVSGRCLECGTKMNKFLKRVG